MSEVNPSAGGEPCEDVASLLQPFVDAELSASEHDLVAEHVESCDACSRAIRVQQEVRMALQQLPRDAAPPGLRGRVLDLLDEEEAGVVELRSRKSRGGAFLRGVGVMLPAAAAAIGLFFVVSGSGTGSGGEPTASASEAIPVSRADAEAPPVEARTERTQLPKLSPSPAVPRRLPDGVELVSAPTELRYQDRRTGRSLREWADPAGNPTGTQQMFRGVQYWLSHDATGRPRVQVRHQGVLYTLVDESAPRGVPAKLETSQFRSLVSFSHEVRADPH